MIPAKPKDNQTDDGRQAAPERNRATHLSSRAIVKKPEPATIDANDRIPGIRSIPRRCGSISVKLGMHEAEK